jgi:arylsulfatase
MQWRRRTKKLGIVPADAVLPAYPKNLPDWNSITPEQRDLENLRMAVYAAMVERFRVLVVRLRPMP